MLKRRIPVSVAFFAVAASLKTIFIMSLLGKLKILSIMLSVKRFTLYIFS